MRTYNGGPAYPLIKESEGSVYKADEGMTLRDYFAGQALASIAGFIAAASPASIEQASKEDHFSGTRGDYTAQRAYRLADAMLAERSK